MEFSMRKFILMLLSGLFLASVSFAEQNSDGFSGAIYAGKCSCGCGCAASCSCGCEEGGDCRCGEECSEYMLTSSQERVHFGGNEADEYCCMDQAYRESYHAQCPKNDCQFAQMYGLQGIWFPECPPLFRPFIADPRQVTYSVGWRFNDEATTKNTIDVSYADTLAIYRWFNIGYFRGQLQIDIEGALWAIFDPLTFSAPLINADYYVGFPLTYTVGPWSFRLRGYHISSHIGDEFLLNHPGFDRRNPSAEYLDFFASYYLTNDIRVYAGVGYVLQQDESFQCSRFYAEGGLELRLHEIGYIDSCDRLYGTPFFGMHFRYKKDFKNHVDSTYVLGYEWGKLSGSERRIRIFLEYHDGYSVEGQFCKLPSSYLSIRASYGF